MYKANTTRQLSLERFTFEAKYAQLGKLSVKPRPETSSTTATGFESSSTSSPPQTKRPRISVRESWDVSSEQPLPRALLTQASKLPKSSTALDSSEAANLGQILLDRLALTRQKLRVGYTQPGESGTFWLNATKLQLSTQLSSTKTGTARLRSASHEADETSHKQWPSPKVSAHGCSSDCPQPNSEVGLRVFGFLVLLRPSQSKQLTECWQIVRYSGLEMNRMANKPGVLSLECRYRHPLVETSRGGSQY